MKRVFPVTHTQVGRCRRRSAGRRGLSGRWGLIKNKRKRHGKDPTRWECLICKALWLSVKLKIGQEKPYRFPRGMNKFPAAIISKHEETEGFRYVQEEALLPNWFFVLWSIAILIACSDIYEVYIYISVLVNQYSVPGHFDRWPWSF